ncbi:ROK family transcriptional regulator [Amycolatopsis rifamycinica]|uniref:ROK family transcriptional regulator n=1 Tax=Amycolatopsis rifamycinica TaxID=287986 RepID=A0A066U2E6_9PSEU|nr:ROK family transcriptional regulator [Amycolatopsis rifamycinica]
MFTTVLTEGPVARVDVARRTGLSSAAVTKAARPFIEAGYLEELASGGRTAPGAGRPANPLAIRPDREYFVGVKITGDDLIGVVTDLRADVRASAHHALTSHDVGHVVQALADLAGELLSGDLAERAYCLGVAVSGDVDQTSGVVRYSPFLGWRDVPLAALLHEATGLTVTLENDVKALAVAEQWFGEGVGASSFALVTVGTGIGSALVVNGGLIRGAHGVAGEIGHVPVADGGPPCHCGGRGCVEAIASTEAILTLAREVSGEPALTMEDAVARARGGDEPLRGVFAGAGHAIGLGLAALVNLFGPERVVVSGEGVATYDLFEDQIRRTFAVQAFGSAARCGLVIRPLPFEEWARGAAAVAIQSLFVAESV